MVSWIGFFTIVLISIDYKKLILFDWFGLVRHYNDGFYIELFCFANFGFVLFRFVLFAMIIVIISDAFIKSKNIVFANCNKSSAYPNKNGVKHTTKKHSTKRKFVGS